MMRINLLPKEERGRSGGPSDGTVWGWVALTMTAAVVIAGTVYHLIIASSTRAQEAALLAEVMSLRHEQQLLAAERAENDDLEAALGELAQLISVEQNLEMIQLLTDSTQAVPAGVWLDLLAVDSGRSLYASGYAAGTGNLSALLRNLEAVSSVDHVQLQTMERVQTLVGLRRPFSIHLTTEGAADDAAADDSSEDELAAEKETP